ncbi:hypothetical protein WICPIJ_004338 [Wickerhamomyces pijperi]|uniref:Small ribosomal subunit protein bS18m n=1 Tax=Wickerhamomyces pijperi TaxID=599730 RepID=A0A9P8Q5R8_WICPI|nr:hypothetical protein WICPIJ_004338 [Wickerhamomyces pijperi]
MFSSLKYTAGRRFFSISRTVCQEKPKSKTSVLLESTMDAALNLNRTMEQAKTNTILPSLIKNFNAGETYDPFDFSIAKLNLDRKQKKLNLANETGVFDKKKLNPLDYYTSPNELNKFVSSTGRIQARDVTKLTLKNQKRLSKAIKRSRAVGLMSSVHRVI